MSNEELGGKYEAVKAIWSNTQQQEEEEEEEEESTNG
jgi:hypothetical protein